MAVERKETSESAGIIPEKTMGTQQSHALLSFVQFAFPLLDLIESNTLMLEKNPGTIEIIDRVSSIFLDISEKAHLLGLHDIGRLSLDTQKIMDQLCNSTVPENQGVIEVVLAVCDLLQTMVQNVNDGVEQGPQASRIFDITGLQERISGLSSGLYNQTGMQCGGGRMTFSGGDDWETGQGRFSVKVDGPKLQDLLDGISELGEMQNALNRSVLQEFPHSPLSEKLIQFLDKNRHVQEMAASLRLVPVGRVFQKVASYVRDLCRKTGRNVHFIVRGETTEIAYEKLDSVHDCIVHLVRNAVDHGLVHSEQTDKKGTGRILTIRLSASKENGSVRIEVSDDGEGLDIDKIREKALERGLIDRASFSVEKEGENLIFLPGLSTVDEISSVSGRGVGLSVVKKTVEDLMGDIEIKPDSGTGLHFVMHLPLAD